MSSFLISLGIGAPAGITEFILVGLTFGGAGEPVEPAPPAIASMPTITIETQMVASVWADAITNDAAAELSLHYGIDGNGPVDRVAGTGACSFALFNDDNNTGEQLGWYSPFNPNKRFGWNFDVPMRVVFAVGDTSSVFLVRIGSTVGGTTADPHGLSDGMYVTITDAGDSAYNGTHQVTVTGVVTFEFTITGTPATPVNAEWRRAYVKFRGKIQHILPDAGAYSERRVYVTAYDHMNDLAEADARSVDMQVGKSEVELIEALLDSIPAESQPPARDLDSAVDNYPFAFDDLKEGRKAISVLNDVVISTFGLGFIAGDGTFRYINRSTLSQLTSQFSFDNNMHGLVVPSSLAKVFRYVRATTNPKVPSPEATDVLYELPAGNAIEVPASSTTVVWTDYTDPNDRNQHVGGVEVEEILVGDVHYSANAQSNGLGASFTGDVIATIEPFASTAKWTFENTAGVQVYITLISPIGKAVRNPGPQHFEASVGAGNRPISINLKYQDAPWVGQGVADHVINLWSASANQIDAIEFMANYSDEYMLAALGLEIGDVITISEEVTGISSIQAEIRSVELRVENFGATLWCKWGLAPAASVNEGWLLGVAGRGELGEATILGF